MSEAPSADTDRDLPSGEVLTAEAQRRQKRMAVGAVAVFASAVMATVAMSWPSPCERVAKHICENASSADCQRLRELIETRADQALCAEQMSELRKVDASSKGDARRYRYLGVIQTLVGEAPAASAP